MALVERLTLSTEWLSARLWFTSRNGPASSAGETGSEPRLQAVLPLLFAGFVKKQNKTTPLRWSGRQISRWPARGTA